MVPPMHVLTLDQLLQLNVCPNQNEVLELNIPACENDINGYSGLWYQLV